RGTIWEIGSYGASQIIRLGGNLVLTRLLFPEAFGLSSLVTITVIGLCMLTDMGLEQSVIRSPRGDDPRFLDTAWTMHVVRGVSLGVLLAFCAWPVGWLLDKSEFVPYSMVGAFQRTVFGLTSTSIFTLRRRMRLAWVNGLELSSQILALGVMIAWA